MIIYSISFLKNILLNLKSLEEEVYLNSDWRVKINVLFLFYKLLCFEIKLYDYNYIKSWLKYIVTLCLI